MEIWCHMGGSEVEMWCHIGGKREKCGVILEEREINVVSYRWCHIGVKYGGGGNEI